MTRSVLPVMKYLAIDYGLKRTGLAVADDQMRIPLPLEVIKTSSSQERIRRIAVAIEDQGADALVLGLPLNMDGSEGPASKNARDFSRQLADAFGLPVHLVDERLTSHEAQNALSETGLSSRKTKPHRDAVAAAAILRDFLQQQTSEQGQPETCP